MLVEIIIHGLRFVAGPVDARYGGGDGGEGRVAAREDQQLLSQAEERVLVIKSTHLTASGYSAYRQQKLRLAKINDASSELVS